MSAHTATTLAYVRTSASVVKVLAGECVPDDVLPSELERLVGAGVLLEVDPEKDPDPEGDQPPPTTKPSRVRKTAQTKA